jgi:DNA-binding NtrC family response regulator
MKLLIVGDLGGQLIQASRIAKKNGAKVYTVPDVMSAMHAVRSGKSADIIMVEVSQDIKGFIESLKSEKIYATVVACGIESDKDKAVMAIRAGAKEYVPLPPEEDLMAAIFEAITGSDVTEVIYKSQAFADIIKMAKQIAPSEASVLITGESGTGKEVISKFIHSQSKRKNKDFISVNCAAIPENLLESELFGHEKGAFTGAIERRIGKFEEANGGTILLDEVSEMDLRLQAKLLRAIQEREICRVGGNNQVNLDIRIIATTNRNLLKEVKDGRFREDLYYRLNVITLHLPPLRDRVEDIELLSKYFITKYAALNGINEKQFSSEAMAKMLKYQWPGNVRELENAVHRSLLLACQTEIEPKDLLIEETEPANDDEPQARTLENIEKSAIQTAIDKCYGDEVKAAVVLGISIRTLRNKLKQYKLTANS